MSLFTPDSPASRAVRELLHQHKAGLSIPHIRRQAPARGDMSPITINPAHLADLLGDEAERMELYLHLIESANFVQRLDDITVQASTRLLAPAAEIVEQVRAYRDELVDMGLVVYKSREFEDGGSYHYPVLLPPGEERLRAGMRFD
jgi:hypothetical protein